MKVAEAAKFIENIQRYVNISLINEFAQLFDTLGIDIKEVITAASTKWNFHYYYPGLINGPCLESASAYLIAKAEQQGFDTKIICASQQRNGDLLHFVRDKLKENCSQEKK